MKKKKIKSFIVKKKKTSLQIRLVSVSNNAILIILLSQQRND